MKRMEIFCSSPASIATCSSIDQRSIIIPRTHKILIDQQQQNPRTSTTNLHNYHRIIKINNPTHHHVPCSSQLPINPKPYFEKTRKSTSCSGYSNNKPKNYHTTELRRKSSADIYDLKGHRDIASCYLLGETPSFMVDWFPKRDDDKAKLRSLSSNDNSSNNLMIRSSSSTRTRHQVVVLRVSLHCKGCEGKVKKHLSKMEGVTSFSIDMATKKVTVIGDVTPLGVLASVSKVKNAQLWPSATSLSTPSSPWST